MLLIWIIGAAVFGLDFAVKRWASAVLTGSGLVPVAGLLELRLTHNDGMALGIMSGSTVAIILLPMAVIAVGWYMMRHYVPTGFTQTAMGLILGGFLGNFAERLFKGYVVDMIFFPFMPWFVCNIADIAICVGVLLLALSLLFRPGDWREKHAKDETGSPN